MLDPISLRVFVRTVEEGTVAAAARKEHLAAAALSKRISELEATLRTPLLERSNKGVTPTEAGRALVQLARRVLGELHQVQVQMHDFTSGVRGHVRVVANLSAIAQFLPQDLKSFLAVHPAVQVHLEERISAEAVQALENHGADVGIFIAADLRPPHLQTFAYRQDELMVLLPQDHPLAAHRKLTFSACVEHEFVGLHTGSAINLQLFDAARRLHRTPKVRIQVTSYEALGRMVHAGLGLGLMPRELAKQHARTLAVKAIPLQESWAKRELVIGVRSFAALPDAARRLVEHLRSSGGRE
jgi:DNA-binding transcriptional LysR family regulator